MTIPNSVLQFRADYGPGSFRCLHGNLHMKWKNTEWNESTLPKRFDIRWKSCGIRIFILGNVTTFQITRTDISSIYIYFVINWQLMPSETRWKKVTNSANLWCSLRYCVTPASSFFLSCSMSDLLSPPVPPHRSHKIDCPTRFLTFRLNHAGANSKDWEAPRFFLKIKRVSPARERGTRHIQS